MSEDKKLKEEFYVVLNISSNLKEEKLLHRYKMFIRDIKIILKDNNFNEYEINLEDNTISIRILNKTLKEIANVFKCLTYIQIMAIEKYKFLLRGVIEYNKKDLVDSFEEEMSNKFYINYLSIYYEDNNEEDFFNIMLKHKKFIKERLIENSKEFYKIMGVSGKRILEKQFFYMEFKENLKNKEEEFYQIMVKLKDNEKKILKIREKYLYLLNYHNRIVFSLIKFGAYNKEDRRRSCSINLEEII